MTTQTSAKSLLDPMDVLTGLYCRYNNDDPFHVRIVGLNLVGLKKAGSKINA